jgi:cell division protein FtsB
MKQTRRKSISLSVHRIWFGIFAVWAFFLTGALSGFVGGPGALQALRLQNLLHSKTGKLQNYQTQLAQIRSEASLLENSPVVQQREIRRVLGYVASDEIIFDF